MTSCPFRSGGRAGQRLPAQSFELGGVLVERANRFLAERPGAEAALRRVLTLKLATVREDGEPTRRRAAREEFSDEEWRLVSQLSGYPNRLLVTATTEGGGTYAEVAHEAIFRRWGKLAAAYDVLAIVERMDTDQRIRWFLPWLELWIDMGAAHLRACGRRAVMRQPGE
jgi:hypothetical protein